MEKKWRIIMIVISGKYIGNKWKLNGTKWKINGNKLTINGKYMENKWKRS